MSRKRTGPSELMDLLRRSPILVVSSRFPEQLESPLSHRLQRRLKVVDNVMDFDRVLSHGNVGLLVLDTRVPDSPGEFDCVLAARRHHRGPEPPAKTLLCGDGTTSSEHLAEEASVSYRDGPLQGHLLGVVCGDHAGCLAEAIPQALDGMRWSPEQETHLRRDFLHAERPLLCQVLERNRAGSEIMIATAAKPWGYEEMAKALARSPKALREALRTQVRPDVIRLGWIRAEHQLTFNGLGNLVNRRYKYFRQYAARERPELYERLFLAA